MTAADHANTVREALKAFAEICDEEGFTHLIDDPLAALDALEAQAKAADRRADALREYGRHEERCASRRNVWKSGKPTGFADCDCGLDAALAGEDSP